MSTQPSDNTAEGQLERFRSDSKIQARFDSIELLGHGGMGSVYSARDKKSQKFVALKVIRAESCSQNELERFYREKQINSLMNDKRIVAIHELDATESGSPFLVMDLARGMSLEQIVRSTGALPLDRVLHIFLLLCKALEYAHGLNILHRDIKPSNIMVVVDDDGTEDVRILDFGIAKLVDDVAERQRLTHTGQTMGSPLYMSPEQIRGKDIDQRSDVYSLCCTMYECLTGVPPFFGDSSISTMYKHMNESVSAMQDASLGRRVPDWLESIVMKGLSKNSADRFATIRDLRIALEERRKFDLPISSEAVGDAPPAAPGGRNRVYISVCLGLIVLGGVICAALGVKPFTGQKNVETAGVQDGKNFNQKLLAADSDAQRIFESKVKKAEGTEFSVSGMEMVRDDMLKSLVYLPKNVKVLHLSNNSFTDAGLKYVKDLPIETLTLQNCDVKTLDALHKNSNLRDLDVSGCKLNKAAIDNIASMSNLRKVNLSAVALPDSAFDGLIESNSLKVINLEGNSISEQKISNLRKALPSVKIIADVEVMRRFPQLGFAIQHMSDDSISANKQIAEAEGALALVRSAAKHDDLQRSDFRAVESFLKGLIEEKKGRFPIALTSYLNAIKFYPPDTEQSANCLCKAASVLERMSPPDPARALELRISADRSLDRMNYVSDSDFEQSKGLMILQSTNQIVIADRFFALKDYSLAKVYYQKAEKLLKLLLKLRYSLRMDQSETHHFYLIRASLREAECQFYMARTDAERLAALKGIEDQFRDGLEVLSRGRKASLAIEFEDFFLKTDFKASLAELAFVGYDMVADYWRATSFDPSLNAAQHQNVVTALKSILLRKQQLLVALHRSAEAAKTATEIKSLQ